MFKITNLCKYIKIIFEIQIKHMIINKKLLAKYSIYPNPSNYDFSEIMNYVDVAEKIWLVPVIGIDFYEELVDQVSRNDVSDVNSTFLVEAVYPYLGFAVCYEALPMTWARVSEVGIVKGKSDNADSISLKDMTYVQNHIRNQVEVRKEFLIKWLMSHAEYYPLIWNCDCECSCRMNDRKVPNRNAQLYSTWRQDTCIR